MKHFQTFGLSGSGVAESLAGSFGAGACTLFILSSRSLELRKHITQDYITVMKNAAGLPRLMIFLPTAAERFGVIQLTFLR